MTATRYGNLDHVLIGPAGVFVIDSKHYLGRVSVARGIVTVARRSNPLGTYEDRRVAPRLRGAGAELSRELSPVLGRGLWVQGVVAIWSDFKQGEAKQENIVFLQAEELLGWVRRQPQKLGADEVDFLATVVESKPAATVEIGTAA